MNIMFFSGLAIGGAEKVATILAGQFANKHHQVSILSFVKGNDEGYAVDDKVKIYCADVNKNEHFRILKRLSKILKIVRAEKPDCIICLATGGIYPLFAAKAVRSRFIISERSNPNKSMGRKDKLNKKISFHGADAVVFQTEYARQQYSKKVQKKSVIIPNPLASDLPEIYSGIRKKRIAAVGRMITAKNYPMLFAAFKKFVTRYPEYVLEVYGNGPKEQETRKLAEEDEVLNEKVIFKGFVSNVNEKIRDCAMYVSSSNHEGLSNSILEALALGLPTISTDCPAYGAREYIQNNITGILVPVSDAEGLYSAMCTIVEDGWLTKDLSANAKDIREKLAASTIADCWLRLVGQ